MNQWLSRHITHSMDFESVQCMSVIINLMCLWWWVICNKQFEEFALSTQSNVVFFRSWGFTQVFSYSKISEKVCHKVINYSLESHKDIENSNSTFWY